MINILCATSTNSDPGRRFRSFGTNSCGQDILRSNGSQQPIMSDSKRSHGQHTAAVRHRGARIILGLRRSILLRFNRGVRSRVIYSNAVMSDVKS
ncbi:uncharacterized protein FOMMEDRAFT_20778 [Fomitiporia mediterranea MF3/22]|uniref:uncharacterized protein n=1 Tax=Fomitiporia mediterranea (strain MF3/22) TaxID=694068 RepID=UPI0004409861|nr:uncharacterized protein FOMMEDRAFT_20778 [Fomitiporia mediterranea MF3/22]EJD02012.1 hypothetical protein FOMMEDRAFT_20778 [Fomitiporia mediterranea MF3/22]